MKLLAYQTQDSIPELLKLCRKILANNKSITIRVASFLDASELSEAMWKFHTFVPHGIEGQDFDSMQPVLIAWNDIKRDVFINFESVHINHYKLKFEPESFILWNCKDYQGNFKTYKQTEDGRWI